MVVSFKDEELHIEFEKGDEEKQNLINENHSEFEDYVFRHFEDVPITKFTIPLIEKRINEFVSMVKEREKDGDEAKT